MKTYKNLFAKLCSCQNLELAYLNARKGKSNLHVVEEFEKHCQLHLVRLMKALRDKTYRPMPLKTFLLRDPKTRTICVSDFSDRVLHHAVVNVLLPIFESRFIFDSYASRIGKGTLSALHRFDLFTRKAKRNKKCFVLKADIYHYFESVDQEVLLRVLAKRIHDANVLWLIKTILENYNSGTVGKGMPLGNWTSQFFANVYLNEFDQFVKHKLKAKYYIHYVDDFVILHHSRTQLEEWQQRIAVFLESLKLKLHPQKTIIIPLRRGVSFLGFRCFYHHKIVRQKNLRKIKARLADLLEYCAEHICEKEEVLNTLQGWNAYAMHGKTHHLRQRLTVFVEQELHKGTASNH